MSVPSISATAFAAPGLNESPGVRWQGDVMRVEDYRHRVISYRRRPARQWAYTCEWWHTDKLHPTLMWQDDASRPSSAEGSDPDAVLTVREHENGPGRWSTDTVALCQFRQGHALPATSSIGLGTGFQAASSTSVSTARHAPVNRMGLLAVRDVVSHLKSVPEQRHNLCLCVAD